MDTNDDRKRVGFYMDAETHDMLKTLARLGGRSLSGEVVFLIRNEFRKAVAAERRQRRKAHSDRWLETH